MQLMKLSSRSDSPSVCSNALLWSGTRSNSSLPSRSLRTFGRFRVRSPDHHAASTTRALLRCNIWSWLLRLVSETVNVAVRRLVWSQPIVAINRRQSLGSSVQRPLFGVSAMHCRRFRLSSAFCRPRAADLDAPMLTG